MQKTETVYQCADGIITIKMTQTIVKSITNEDNTVLFFAAADAGELGGACVVLGLKCQRSFIRTLATPSPEPDTSSPDVSPLPLSSSPNKIILQ